MINGILESYENPWDVFAELAQNSIDAIRRADPEEPQIRISLNNPKRKISWSDNGCGIDPSNFEELFVPYGGNKRDDPDSIGEKGVGLKFIIFSTNRFCLTSRHEDGSFQVEVEGAADWLRSGGVGDISYTSTEIEDDEGECGVEIQAYWDSDDDEIFDLHHEQIKNLLLIKTACGDTQSIWESGGGVEISLKTKSSDGKKLQSTFAGEYRLPTARAKKVVSIAEFSEWAEGGTKSDEQKRRKLKDAIITDSGTTMVSDREVKFWSCMMPSRTQWAHLAKQDGLVPEDDDDDFDGDEHFFAHDGGVYLATKRMPTGVAIDLRPTGEAGYADNFFILIEDDGLSFDIGRKGVPPATSGKLRKIAQNEYKKYLRYKKFIRGEAIRDNDQFEREQLFEDVKSLPDMKLDSTRFLKRPKAQEATVAALFYEYLGRGGFEGFNPYISGYRDRYDLTGRVGKKNLVIEFKYDLLGLFKDFAITRKLFNELNVVVVWEITEGDRQRAADRGIEIEEIDGDAEVFPEATHELIIDSCAPVEVVEMKSLLSA